MVYGTVNSITCRRSSSNSPRIPELLLALPFVVLFAASSAAGQGPVNAAAATGSPHKAIVTRYCVSCHNERLQTAELLLDKADIGNVAAAPELWEKVVRKLRAGQMPPVGIPRPDGATYQSLISFLEGELDASSASKPNPGRTTDHRLNRAEYANAIRDLLGIEIDSAALLPPDDASSGFDNIGEVLSVSPLLMERYMLAAGKISRLAIGDSDIQPGAEEYKLPQYLMQEDRASDDLPFGSRGGIAVRHNFPTDGEYVLRIRLQRNADGYIRGLTEPHQLDVRLDGSKIKRFTIGGELRGRPGPVFTRNDPDYRGDPTQVEYEMSADDDLEVRFPAQAGSRVVGVTFLKETTLPEGIYTPPLLSPDISKYKGGNPVVDSVTVIGPYNVRGKSDIPSRNKVFVCQPASAGEEEPCAREILGTLARRAYRRPVYDKDIATLLAVYKSARQEEDFEAGIELALQRILAGPEFLFRVERDPGSVPAGSVYRISDLELASRLSFFLWSSIPDDELLQLAEQGTLQDAAVLNQQIQRMLADQRASALVSNFAGQWLDIRNLKQASPDPREFPDFDDELREGFQKETELFFASMLKEDRSVVDLLDADYTFLNERLARHYGAPNVFGSHFRRVAVTDEARRGLLGQGTILTVTSRANRTSPVLRGKWVLENLLGSPPPPPPPNVPALEAKDTSKPVTMRQMVEQHRDNPACSGCHNIMDPLGFALENFDAIGKWRTTDAYIPVDASGKLPDGTVFRGVVELRRILAGHPDQFVHTVAEKLLTYALGRELRHSDMPAVRGILREAQSNEYRWSSLILGVVKSTPFQMRRAREL